MQTTIEKSISTEAVSGFKRIARHEAFVIQSDLNMVQQVRVITLDAATGRPMLDTIRENDQLTGDQQQAALVRYADQIVTRQTAGAYVDAAGRVVAPDAAVAIGQREYFQAFTLGDLKRMGLMISDKTSVATLIYALINNEITNIDNRGGL